MSSGSILPLAIRRHATARPRALAVRDDEGDQTFADLDRAADVAAGALRASGVGPRDRVAVLAAPAASTVALLVGILRAGAVAVPLGTRLTRREVVTALEETSPALVVHDADLGSAAAGHGVRALLPGALLARSPGGEGRSLDLDPLAPAVAVLTTGTTGRPRGALLSHAALAASAAAWLAVLPPATGWLLCLGLSHVAGLGVMWRALAAGLPLHVPGASDADAVLRRLAGAGAPSHLSMVPVQLARLLDAAGGAPPPVALRALLLGGSPIPPELSLRAAAAGWPVVPTYGLTEAGSGVTALAADEVTTVPGSAGRALPGIAVRIAEPGPDDIGEIEVHSPAAFSGYLGRPGEEAAEAFTADGWLRTGDMGRLDASGRLFVADRRADLVISGGENVYPSEVEAVLAAHPAVAEAGVAGRPDATWGAVPVAGIVLRGDVRDPGDQALRAWCEERLAPYKVPAAFRRLEALPRTQSGKLRRHVLRERLAPLLVVLHATLSTGRQLAPLVRVLSAPGDLRVIAPDRRGSGDRRLDPPRPVGIGEHVADLAALLDAEGADRAILLGHSFGGLVAIEAAARLPERVIAVVAYEPPYGPLGDAEVRQLFELVARETEDGLVRNGPAGAARAFLQRVAGPGTWEAMPERARSFVAAEGGGAVADAALTGVDPDGLAGIACPVTILTGSASDLFYASIAAVLAERIPGASLVGLSGLRHTAPITDPVPVADAVRSALANDAGIPLPASREAD